MNMKKQYEAPLTHAIKMDAAEMLAASQVKISDKITEDDAIMTQKGDNPWQYTWE